MSFNRTIYDNCAYKQSVSESTGTLAYMLNPIKYEVCNSGKCRNTFGLTGGSNVRLPRQKLVEVESELWNITRPVSRCASKKYIPQCSSAANSNNDNGLPCGPYQLTTPDNTLKGCHLATYKPKATSHGYSLPGPACSNARF